MLLLGCTTKSDQNSDKENALFKLIGKSSGIHFENNLTYTEDFNPYVYRNFFNGGGVAIGDINNDGLADVYFTGNMVDNKLFLNKGNWQFEDITEIAGVACENIWSSGVTFADVNGDGFLDIYVCKAGKPEGDNRHNELFINNGDLTFTESSAKYGLDITGLSVHSAFFDYDKDGDLDMYLLNNSIKSVGGFDLIENQRQIANPNGSGNKFFRNDNGYYTDVTTDSGIYSSGIGFGLGITLGDFNTDNWTDIYITNDFFEKDYLYLNNKKGGFNEVIDTHLESTSMGAMGADFADLNNDLLADLFVTEMLPQTLQRQKNKTLFESWDKYQLAVKKGYHNQFSRNTLQRNLGNDTFIEIGRMSGVAATEWSWSALLFDANNDGLNDIFISNGIYKDLLDRDYLTYDANDEVIKSKINSKEKNVITDLIDAMPSGAIPNAVFKNNSNFNFEPINKEWGLDTPSFSNGSAYGDLDNDGDLDLVVNNVNMPSFVYENTTDTLINRSISFKLIQNNKNTKSLGAKVIIKYDDQYLIRENFTSKGFQSSIPSTLHFGVNSAKVVDSLWIIWPDSLITIKTNLKTNNSYTIAKDTVRKEPKFKTDNFFLTKSPLTQTNTFFKFEHQENTAVDFNKERLLTQMYSNEGPAYATADINNDNVADFYLGGAKHQAGRIYISSNDGSYKEITTPFEIDAKSEDTDAIFFDADNDGDKDLYVCHGGKTFSAYSQELNDVLYINENGNFIKAKQQPSFNTNISSSVVISEDYDQDGDIDLFVGERFKINTYGLPGSGYLLTNDGTGNFNVSQPENLRNIGMITDAIWSDIDSDGQSDLVIAGEWMSIKIYLNQKSQFVDKTSEYGLDETKGLWNTIEIVDIDNNGTTDIIAGNFGRNTLFKAPMRMYVSDFDNNGFKEQIICQKINDKYYPVVDKDELISQIPSLKKKLIYYKDYAEADISAIFDKEQLDKAQIFDLNLLETCVFSLVNNNFSFTPLPNEIQSAPTYAILAKDFNKDGAVDLIFGGNQFLVKPQFGSYDGSQVWAIFGNQKEPNNITSDPLYIKGQIRHLDWINNTLIVIKNNENTEFYTFNE